MIFSLTSLVSNPVNGNAVKSKLLISIFLSISFNANNGFKTFVITLSFSAVLPSGKVDGTLVLPGI